LVGVAVKLTVAPVQTVVASAAMETLTGNELSTVMIMELEVAGLPVAQVALEVRIQVTTSPFAGVYV